MARHLGSLATFDVHPKVGACVVLELGIPLQRIGGSPRPHVLGLASEAVSAMGSSVLLFASAA